MKLTCKICNLDKPNRNGHIYKESCFMDKVGETYPVRFISDDLRVDVVTPIGSSTITDLDYPELTLDLDIFNEIAQKCLKNNIGGFGFSGMVSIKNNIIDELKVSSLGYTDRCAVEQIIEIVEE